ncbi:MAG: PIN domain-containing protein [Candidatus Omnitrophota bacterium]|jgi:predicted nucleic acid-binding protein|nr:MAG: PIN domain-containing protein [Candidatus Omnitrophota bacterium]
MNIVVDASVVGRWFFTESLKDAADHYLHPQYTRYAPDLLIHEFTSIVRHKTQVGIITTAEGIQIIKDFEALKAIQFIPSADLSEKAYQIAVEFDHPVYDCFYLAVAEKLKSVLITADQQFFKVIKASSYANLITWIEDFPKIQHE